jgi:hypothetical protein
MQLEIIFSSLENIPKAALLLFIVLGVVLVVEVWYLRPKRKLPPIPTREGGSATPPPTPKLTRFRPLKKGQILLTAFLLILLVVIPLGTFLLKQTWEAEKRIASFPSLPPTIIPLPTPGASLKPTFLPSPTPELTTSPSATPGELAWTLPTPSPKPTRSPEIPSKGAPAIASPSPTLPAVKKPEELPEAAVSEQLILLTLLSLSVLSLGILTLRKAGPGTSEKKR